MGFQRGGNPPNPFSRGVYSGIFRVGVLTLGCTIYANKIVSSKKWTQEHLFSHTIGWVTKKARRWDKCCCLTTKPIILICSIGFSNLPDFNRPFFSSKWYRKPILKTFKKCWKNKQDFPLFSFLPLITLVCVRVFCPFGRIPWIKYSY